MRPAPLIAIIQHQDECPPGRLAQWLTEAGAQLAIVRADLGVPLPDPTEFAGLIVLGGVMGATDDGVAPWLPAVRALIAAAADVGVPTLGICLGHQLAAVALGGRVTRNPNGKQRGLTPIGFTPTAGDDPLFGPDPNLLRGVHSNNDIVAALPDAATVLALAPGGEIQAARFAATSWGVQWHPEVDEEIFATWCALDPPADETHAQQAIAEVAAARDELDAAWRPLAERFVELCATTSNL
ncbi:MAG: type 1 glutamine amidotransferase [Micropruina sp.]|uniref:type 1 glutamine amidotransferase n=1 Tax=Micropruina sp. TaxID=2737536 RepID=UPI0039E2F41F